jgi:hypothetical protein
MKTARVATVSTSPSRRGRFVDENDEHDECDEDLHGEFDCE